MSPQDRALKLVAAFPGAQWSFDDSKDDYSGLDWLDDKIPKPTQAQFDSALRAPDPGEPTSDVEQLAALLATKGVISAKDAASFKGKAKGQAAAALDAQAELP